MCFCALFPLYYVNVSIARHCNSPSTQHCFLGLLTDFHDRSILCLASSKQNITIFLFVLLSLQFTGKHPKIHSLGHSGSSSFVAVDKVVIISFQYSCMIRHSQRPHLIHIVDQVYKTGVMYSLIIHLY